jgi:hypothetical protein
VIIFSLEEMTADIRTEMHSFSRNVLQNVHKVSSEVATEHTATGHLAGNINDDIFAPSYGRGRKSCELQLSPENATARKVREINLVKHVCLTRSCCDLLGGTTTSVPRTTKTLP